MNASDAAVPAGEGMWRERWYGSEPQRGSAIVDARGNLIVHFGGDEGTHRLTTKIVSAHNAAMLATSPKVASDTGAGVREALIACREAALHAPTGKVRSTIVGIVLAALNPAKPDEVAK